jgi:hypothetical protein
MAQDDANQPTTEWIGTKRVYHATNRAGLLKVLRGKDMKPRTEGLFGPGIYFAATPESAVHQGLLDDEAHATLVTADVNFGRALVVEGAHRDLNRDEVNARGADSVKGRSSSRANWQYVVYEPTRVNLVQFCALPQVLVGKEPVASAEVLASSPGLAAAAALVVAASCSVA